MTTETDNGATAQPDVLDDRLPDERNPVPADKAVGAVDTLEEPAASEAETPPEEGEDPGDDPAADANEPKKAKGVQKRIDELTRQREDAKRERDQWRQMAMQGQQPAQKPQPQPVSPVQQSAPPRQEDFGNNYEAYIVACAKHELREEIGAANRRDAEARAAYQAEQAQKALATKMDEARTKYDDFDTVLEAASSTALPDAVLHAIAESELAGDLTYHLATNADALRKLATLSPLAAVRELGRIELKLQTPDPAPAPVPVKTSKAPAPIKPLGGSDKAVRDPAAMSNEEYRAWRLGKKAS